MVDTNENEEHESENIRQPDQVITDILIDDPEYDIEYELHRIIHLSMLEFKCKEEQEEQELLRLNIEEIKNITTKFSTIKEKINKMHQIDKINKEIYEDILSYIELHDITYKLYYEVDVTAYNTIFKCINRIRFSTDEIKLLKDLIIIKTLV